LGGGGKASIRGWRADGDIDLSLAEYTKNQNDQMFALIFDIKTA
jgi:hypothetical protein